ncbi:hypothetical protein K9N50_11520 [bacterium]|nr:hypothetical protein [bacterium]
MSSTLSKTSRRVWVVINYVSLIMLIILYRLGHFKGWSVLIVVSLIVVFTILQLSFTKLYKKTGLWKLTHSKVNDLDEREIQLTHEALRYSYSIFVINCLLIIFISSILEIDMIIDVISGVTLLYLAHTLPASVIAWTEREV